MKRRWSIRFRTRSWSSSPRRLRCPWGGCARSMRCRWALPTNASSMNWPPRREWMLSRIACTCSPETRTSSSSTRPGGRPACARRCNWPPTLPGHRLLWLFRHVHGAGGRTVDGRGPAPHSSGRRRHRLRTGCEPEHCRTADAGRRDLRPRERAARQDHDREGAGGAGKFRRLCAHPYERDSEGGRILRREHGSTERSGRTAHPAPGSGHLQRTLRSHKTTSSGPARIELRMNLPLNLRRLVCSIVFLWLLPGSFGQRLAGVPPRRLTHLRHGINASEWFAQVYDPRGYTKEHLETWTTAEDIALIKAMGFDHVRLSVNPEPMFRHNHADEIAAEYLGYLDNAVKMILDHDLAVVIDIHPESNFKANLAHDEFVEQFSDYWRALANHYSRSDPDRVFFEILNEPEMSDRYRWYGIQAKLAVAIREGAPQHT